MPEERKVESFYVFPTHIETDSVDVEKGVKFKVCINYETGVLSLGLDRGPDTVALRAAELNELLPGEFRNDTGLQILRRNGKLFVDYEPASEANNFHASIRFTFQVKGVSSEGWCEPSAVRGYLLAVPDFDDDLMS